MYSSSASTAALSGLASIPGVPRGACSREATRIRPTAGALLRVGSAACRNASCGCCSCAPAAVGPSCCVGSSPPLHGSEVQISGDQRQGLASATKEGVPPRCTASAAISSSRAALSELTLVVALSGPWHRSAARINSAFRPNAQFRGGLHHSSAREGVSAARRGQTTAATAGSAGSVRPAAASKAAAAAAGGGGTSGGGGCRRGPREQQGPHRHRVRCRHHRQRHGGAVYGGADGGQGRKGGGAGEVSRPRRKRWLAAALCSTAPRLWPTRGPLRPPACQPPHRHLLSACTCTCTALRRYIIPGGSAAHFDRQGFTFDVGSSMMFGFGDKVRQPAGWDSSIYAGQGEQLIV